MKTRNGFVSNSSSSSFVVLGFEANLSYEEMYKKLIGTPDQDNRDIDDIDLADKLYDFFQENNIVLYGECSGVSHDLIGFEIAGQEDYMIKSASCSFPDLKVLFDVVGLLKEKLGVDSEIKLYTGTRNC